MNSRNLVMLLAIIVGSGLLYITNKDDYSRPDPIPTAIASFSELAVEQVVRVEMMLGDASVVLEREGDDWKVPSAWNYPGDRTEIERLLSDVRSISGAHQRASKAESHGTFQVDDAGGLKLALKDSTGTALAELVIGKADGVQRTFIRLANSDEVYSVAPNLRNRAGFAGWSLEAGRWTDKVLFQLPPDSVVTRMHIETAEGNAQLTLKASPAPGTDNPEPGNPEPAGVLLGSDDPEWMVQFSSNAEPVLADESTVKGIISALKNIQSAEPADPSDSAALGLDPVQSFIEIELADGSIHTVQFGSEVDLSVGGKGVAARVIGQQRTALVRNWVLDSLLQVGETLRAVVEPEEPTAAETPAVEAPAVETPAVEDPAAETPAAETPAAETPAAETPAAEDGAPAAPEPDSDG